MFLRVPVLQTSAVSVHLLTWGQRQTHVLQTIIGNFLLFSYLKSCCQDFRFNRNLKRASKWWFLRNLWLPEPYSHAWVCWFHACKAYRYIFHGLDSTIVQNFANNYAKQWIIFTKTWRPRACVGWDNFLFHKIVWLVYSFSSCFLQYLYHSGMLMPRNTKIVYTGLLVKCILLFFSPFVIWSSLIVVRFCWMSIFEGMNS